MRKAMRLFLVACVALAVVACESRTDKADGGGVTLSFGPIDWPALYSAGASAAAGGATITTVTLTSVVKNPGAPTSTLMDVELNSFEVTFTRADTGTRLPPTLVRQFPGVVPVGGTLTIAGLFFMLEPQLLNPPLSDLLAVNGGFDKETGSDTILLNVAIRFFGNTLSGDAVQSSVLRKTVQFTP